jgi:hypothetical protein
MRYRNAVITGLAVVVLVGLMVIYGWRKVYTISVARPAPQRAATDSVPSSAATEASGESASDSSHAESAS